MDSGSATAAAAQRDRLAAAGAVIAASLAIGVSIAAGLWLAPWVLPLRVVEGPYLQCTTETAVTVMWWTTRPSQCELVIDVGGSERVLAADEWSWCNRVRIDGLEAGRSYPYRIRVGRRTLAEATLCTNHRDDRPVRFAVFGDSGLGSPEQYTLAKRMAEFKPDFLLHTGDLIYSGGQRENYPNRFFAPYRALLAERNFWPCLGNHDLGPKTGASPYRAVFELPTNGPDGLPAEDSYWFDYANLRIAVLDSNRSEAELHEQIAPWLTRVFADAGESRWKLVAFHHPPYSVAKHGCDRRVQRALVPVFEALGVDVVFCGHDHVYSRTVPLIGGRAAAPGEHGIVYVVTGAGGASLYSARKEEKDAKDRAPGDDLALYPSVRDNVHSFSAVEIAGNVLRFEQISVRGESLDEWYLARGAASSAPVP